MFLDITGDDLRFQQVNHKQKHNQKGSFELKCHV